MTVNTDLPRPYLLFVGERSGYKNFEGLIEAFASTRLAKDGFHLVCFGGGPFRDRENEKIAALGIGKAVHQVSGSDESLVQYYRNAVAFVFPSRYEGFGIPILEAMELSCPVLCANAGSMPEVGGDAAVYFDPDDISSFAEILERTVLDPDLLLDLKRRGLLRAGTFSWDRCAQETMDLYRSVLRQAG